VGGTAIYHRLEHTCVREDSLRKLLVEIAELTREVIPSGTVRAKRHVRSAP
jgi:hypothetical protein